VTALFDRRDGLTELIYGMTRNKIRSAAEASVKAEQISVRPDDYANTLEDAMSDVARKEALMARWLVEPQDVAPLMGNMAAQAWAMHVTGEDPESIVREYSYRIEAGSARKPNKANRLRTLNEWGQVALPMIQQFATQGLTEPWNAYMVEVGKAMDFDATPFLIHLPQQQGPSPEQIEAEAARTELEMKLVEHQATLQQSQEKHEQEMAQGDQELELEREKTELDMTLAKKKATVDAQVAKKRAAAAKAKPAAKPKAKAKK
jgi:hypothetical protein